MATPPGSAIFYAVLIAPGFVAVMTAIALAAIEDDIKQFVLLIWSLVSSFLIDTLFIAVYQLVVEPITSFPEFQSILFDPSFRTDYILLMFLTSLLVGVLYAAAILIDLPGVLRNLLQAKMQISYSRRQPWEEYLKHADQVMVKTSDDQMYIGDVIGWSRAGREKELRISDPHRYNESIKDFEPVGGPEQFFRDNDIQRVTVLKTDHFLTILTRVRRKLGAWHRRIKFWSSGDQSSSESE